MIEKYYVDAQGKYLPAFSGLDVDNPYLGDATITEVPIYPKSARDTWNFTTQVWDIYVSTVEEQLVSSEDVKDLFKKVEELIENVETNKPLSQETKNWKNNRKNIRGE